MISWLELKLFLRLNKCLSLIYFLSPVRGWCRWVEDQNVKGPCGISYCCWGWLEFTWSNCTAAGWKHWCHLYFRFWLLTCSSLVNSHPEEVEGYILRLLKLLLQCISGQSLTLCLPVRTFSGWNLCLLCNQVGIAPTYWDPNVRISVVIDAFKKKSTETQCSALNSQ